MWKPPRNRVSKTQFLIGVFFLNLTLSVSPFSLTLSLSQPHRSDLLPLSASPTPTHSPSQPHQSDTLTLLTSPTPTPTHSYSPSHSLTHRPTVTALLVTLTQTPRHPLYSLTQSPVSSLDHHRVLVSFSLRGL